VIAGLMIAPLGVVLGIPFPLGICILGKADSHFIPWAWGINAYTTVVGSILCVIFAISWGFRLNFLIACAIYVCGILIFTTKTRRTQSSQR
jgi:hypothetical protein